MLLQLIDFFSLRLGFPAAVDAVGHAHLEMLSHVVRPPLGVPFVRSFISSDPFTAGVAVLSLIMPILSRRPNPLLSSFQPLDFLTSPLGVLNASQSHDGSNGSPALPPGHGSHSPHRPFIQPETQESAFSLPSPHCPHSVCHQVVP